MYFSGALLPPSCSSRDSPLPGGYLQAQGVILAATPKRAGKDPSGELLLVSAQRREAWAGLNQTIWLKTGQHSPFRWRGAPVSVVPNGCCIN